MKKQLLLIGITLVMITVGLSGCNEDEPKTSPGNPLGGYQ